MTFPASSPHSSAPDSRRGQSFPGDVAAAVELLERAVAYTRGTLAGVSSAALTNPTPCRAWDLSRLLDHMDDSLDAFTHASAGKVALAPLPRPSRDAPVLERIHARACTLIGAWTRELSGPSLTSESVRVGDRRLAGVTLVAAGSLEVAIHGWDVGQSTGRPVPLPDTLAAALLPVAHELVTPQDRPRRFAPPATPVLRALRAPGPGSTANAQTPGLTNTSTTTPSTQLLGFLGRIV